MFKRFAQTKPHSLVVVVTGADAMGDRAWAHAAGSALEGQSGTDVALVMFSNPKKTADDIERAISENDHKRLVFIAKDDGVVACAYYLSRMSAGVVEELVAYFTQDVDLPTDIMGALDKMPSVHVLDATGNDPLSQLVDAKVVEVAEPADGAQLGEACAKYAMPQEEEGPADEMPAEPDAEGPVDLPDEGEGEEDDSFAEDDAF
jgi:hypothetical protein